MTVRELARLVDNQTKIAFYYNKYNWYIMKDIISDTKAGQYQRYFRLEQILKDENLLNQEVTLICPVSRKVLLARLRRDKN